MSWTAELLHLFLRDLRRTIWPLMGYVAALSLAVATATESLGSSSRMVASVGQTVLLLAPLLVAMTVVADSTMRVDAFWAAQPIRPSVMIGSKLLYVLMLLGMCGVAILVSLSAWQLQIVSADAISGASFAYFGLLLLGTAVMATACTSMTAVGLLLGVTFALTLGGTLLITSAERALTRGMWTALACVMAAGGALMFARAYRQRGWSTVRRGATLLSGVGVMLVPALTAGESMPEPTFGTPDGAPARVVLRIPLAEQPECDAGRVTLPVEFASPPSWRVEMMRPSVVLTLVDGSSVTLSSDRWMASAGIWGPMIPGAAARIEGGADADAVSTRVRRTGIAFDLTRDNSTRVCGRVAGATLRVQMRASSAAELMRIDLGASGIVSAPGYRAAIESAQVSDTGVAIEVRVAMLGSAMAGRRFDLANLDFALLHRDQRRLLRLYDYESTDRSSMGVLPGLRHMSSTLRLQRYRADAERPSDLSSWRDSAVLLVIAPVWQAFGERVVSATTPLAVTATPP